MIDEQLREKDPLLQIIVSERASADPNVRDDVLQEARIEAWRQIEKGSSPALTHHAVRQKVSGLVHRDFHWTGMETRHGQPVDPLRRPSWDSLDDPDLSLVLEAADVLEAVEWAYHHGEIHEALRALPERHREYAVMRFWGGMSNPEIAAHQGLSKQTVERTWRESIKPTLANELAHLASV